MTETNIPQAGQWWEHVSGIRLLAVSREKPGWIWALFAMDTPPVQVLDQWEGWKHLPDCTGFDWVPEKPICVMCSVNPVVAGTAGCESCNEYAIESAGCPAEIPDHRPARDVIMDIVTCLDPHPPAKPNPQAALDCAEQWLIDNPVKPRYQSDVTCSIGASQRERKEQAEQATKRVPVRLWVHRDCRNDDRYNVFAKINPPDHAELYSEIHSDGNGDWFVEVTK